MVKHALIVGSSGIIGHPLSQYLLLRNDWRVTGISRKNYDHKPDRLNLITCDLTKAQDCEAKLGPMGDITHVFYVTWISKESEEENCKINRQMLTNLLNVLLKKNQNLCHFYLQTGTKHYGNWVGPEKGQVTPAREDDPRLPLPMFYYDLEDVLFSAHKGQPWTYNIARPPTIIGWTVRTAMNFGTSLAVYATVLRQLGQPLIFPYGHQSYHALREFIDSKLLCKFILWLTPEDNVNPVNRKFVANEAFNISNGDSYRMEQLWPKIASYFGMEAKLADKPTTVQEIMKGKEEVWDKVVQEYDLKKFKLNDLGTWDFMDNTLSREFDELTLLQKSVRAGFTEQRDSFTVFSDFFDGLKNARIIPNQQLSSE